MFAPIIFCFLCSVPLGSSLPDRGMVNSHSDEEVPFFVELNERTSGRLLEVTFAADEEIEIPCFYQDYSPPDLVWSTPKNVPVEATLRKDDYSSVSTLRLDGESINNVRQNFTCQTTGLEVNFNATVRVTVTAAKQVQIVTADLSAQTSGRVFPFHIQPNRLTELTCLFQEYNPPRLVWHQNGVGLPSSNSTEGEFVSVAKILVSPGDSADSEFTCQTEGLDPEMKITFQLKVDASTEKSLDYTHHGVAIDEQNTNGSSQEKEIITPVVVKNLPNTLPSTDHACRDDQTLWKDLSIALNIIVGVLLLLIILIGIGLGCVIKKALKPGKIYARNLARDHSILASELGNRPLPKIPSDSNDDNTIEHSYYYPNLHMGMKSSKLGSGYYYETIAIDDAHSYFYPRITEEVLKQIAQD